MGEISKLYGFSKDTLRYYDKIDLFKPSQTDDNGYRYYTPNKMDDLSTIRILRKLDVPIKEIQELLDQDKLDNIDQLLNDKDQLLDEEIQKLKYYRQNVKLLLEAMKDFENESFVQLRMRPKLYSLIIESLIDEFDVSLLNTTDTILKELERYNLWFSFSQNISIVSKENLMKCNYHTYLSNGIISSKPLEAKLKSIETKMYDEELCVFKTAVITDESYRSIDKHYEAMKSWVNRHGYVINGNSMEINIYNQKNRNYIQIWIPVKEKKTDNS
ncbi:MAG: MerR family transcriptional regulator [Spirochaetia bacterium]